MASLATIEKLAHKLMADNAAGIDLLAKGWAYEPYDRKRSIGSCFYERKVISVSSYFAPFLDHADVLNVLKHEIAHAIVGAEHGHGPSWIRIATLLGAEPSSTMRLRIN